MKIETPAWTIFFFLLLIGCNSSNPETDYQIYSTLLAEKFDEERKIVPLETGSDYNPIPNEELKKRLLGLQEETLADFLEKSKSPIKLEERFALKVNVKLISHPDWEASFIVALLKHVMSLERSIKRLKVLQLYRELGIMPKKLKLWFTIVPNKIIWPGPDTIPYLRSD